MAIQQLHTRTHIYLILHFHGRIEEVLLSRNKSVGHTDEVLLLRALHWEMTERALWWLLRNCFWWGLVRSCYCGPSSENDWESPLIINKGTRPELTFLVSGITFSVFSESIPTDFCILCYAVALLFIFIFLKNGSADYNTRKIYWTFRCKLLVQPGGLQYIIR